MANHDADVTAFLQNSFLVDVWYAGTRFDSAERALTAHLATTDDKEGVMLSVLREKFSQNGELGNQLIELLPTEIGDAIRAPDHELWSRNDVVDCLLRVRDEVTGQDLMRTGMLLATHGSSVLMGRNSDLGDDLVEGARRAGIEVDVPTDRHTLSEFEDAMAEAIASRWGDILVELFEMGKTILLYLSMDGLPNDDPEYSQAYEETRKVLQESADRLGLGRYVWTILSEHGSDPAQINTIVRKVVIAAFEPKEV